MSRLEMHTLRFESLVDAGQFAENTPRYTEDKNSSEKTETNHSWDLGMNLDQTIQAVKTGYVWLEGLNSMTQSMQITDELAARSELPRLNRQVVGSIPCVPAHVIGHPRDMYKRTKKPAVDRPVLSIGIPMGIAWFIKAEQRLRFAAAMLSAVDHLERSGYRCEIIGLWRAADDNSNKDYSKWLNIEYMLKRAEDRWNPASLSFLVAHPAAQRRLTWRVAETQEQWHGAINWGYCDNSNTREYQRSMASDFDVYFNNMVTQEATQCDTEKGAFEYVERVINEQLKTAKEAAQVS